LILDQFVNEGQRQQVTEILKTNLVNSSDWIVVNFTMETLFFYAKNSDKIKLWLQPQLERIAKDPRKTVSKRARKYLEQI
jgi:hypothetical protein